MEGRRATSVTSKPHSCNHRQTFKCPLHPHTCNHTHTHLLSKLPPCINTNTRTRRLELNLLWMSRRASACLHACTDKSPAHPPSLPLSVSPPPPPASPLYHNKTPDLLPFHPSASSASRWPGASGRDEGSGIRARGTYRLVRRLLHGDGSSASKHYPPPPSPPSLLCSPPVPSFSPLSSTSSFSKQLDAQVHSMMHSHEHLREICKKKYSLELQLNLYSMIIFTIKWWTKLLHVLSDQHLYISYIKHYLMLSLLFF